MIVVILVLNHIYGWSEYLSDSDNLKFLSDMIQDHFVLAALIYIGLTVVACVVLALPGVTFAILAGVIFGPWWGTLLCLIATTQGVQALTVPVVHDASNAIGDIRISDHGNWRHLHWQALQTAYGDSPFFEYYEDDLRPFFTERHWERLKDYNMSICQKMCELLDIQPTIVQTSDFRLQPSCPPSINPDDFRLGINPKHPLEDVDFQPKPYYQVYQQKHGFLPNLSILDLLFNMGPESIFYL